MVDAGRSESPLSDNERHMILSAYKYFLESRESHGQYQAMTLRKQVATALGYGGFNIWGNSSSLESVKLCKIYESRCSWPSSFCCLATRSITLTLGYEFNTLTGANRCSIGRLVAVNLFHWSEKSYMSILR